jgi:hypothetical protein
MTYKPPSVFRVDVVHMASRWIVVAEVDELVKEGCSRVCCCLSQQVRPSPQPAVFLPLLNSPDPPRPILLTSVNKRVIDRIVVRISITAAVSKSLCRLHAHHRAHDGHHSEDHDGTHDEPYPSCPGCRIPPHPDLLLTIIGHLVSCSGVLARVVESRGHERQATPATGSLVVSRERKKKVKNYIFGPFWSYTSHSITSSQRSHTHKCHTSPRHMPFHLPSHPPVSRISDRTNFIFHTKGLSTARKPSQALTRQLSCRVNVTSSE